MGVDINSPLAQALIAEGNTRGYSPFDIAGSIGNAYAESGGQTNLPTYTDSTASGGDARPANGAFSWDPSRWSAVQAIAHQLKLPVSDPKVQAAAYWNEIDAMPSSEEAKGSDNLADAVHVGIDSLKPAGYESVPDDGSDYSAVPSLNARMSAAQQALQAMQGGSQGVLAQSQAPQAAPASPAQSPDAPFSLHNSLMGLSAAFLRRDSPNAAAQIDQMLQAQMQQHQAMLRAQQATQKWDSGAQYVNKAGQTVIPQTNADGGFREVPLPTGEGDKSLDPTKVAPPLSGNAVARMESNYQNAATTASQMEPTINAIQDIRGDLQNGKLQLGPDKNLGALIDNFAGNSTMNDRNLKSFDSQVTNGAVILGGMLKGAATNERLRIELQNAMPLLAGNDNKAAYQAMGRVLDIAESVYKQQANGADKAAGLIPNFGPVMDGDGNPVAVHDYYQGKIKAMSDRQKALKANEDAFMASPGRGQAAVPQDFVGFLKSLQQPPQ